MGFRELQGLVEEGGEGFVFLSAEDFVPGFTEAFGLGIEGGEDVVPGAMLWEDGVADLFFEPGVEELVGVFGFEVVDVGNNFDGGFIGKGCEATGGILELDDGVEKFEGDCAILAGPFEVE